MTVIGAYGDNDDGFRVMIIISSYDNNDCVISNHNMSNTVILTIMIFITVMTILLK